MQTQEDTPAIPTSLLTRFLVPMNHASGLLSQNHSSFDCTQQRTTQVRSGIFFRTLIKPRFSPSLLRATLPGALPAALFIIHNVVDFDKCREQTPVQPLASIVPQLQNICNPERGKALSVGRFTQENSIKPSPT